jgi:branched-chain amino acid transport system substrate-binding protein
MVQRVVADMVANGVKTVGFIGFSDSWGEVLHKALTKAAEGKITIVASERYGRADPSVQAQVLKVISAKPDAVFVGASGTPPRCPRSPCASAASRAASTSPTASPARSSCGSAARTSKAR